MSAFAMVGTLRARPGQGDALAEILTAGGDATAAAGALIYAVNRQSDDPDTLWVYELWTSKEAHDASLDLDEVKAAIAKAMPLLAGPPDGHHLVPVGGPGVRLP